MSIPAGKWSLVLCCLVFQAGLSRVSGQEPFFKAHPVTSEINNSVLQTILQGSNGFIWLGTSEGIYRFDGINYTLVPSADTLANASITALYESEDGILWAGTHSGLIGQVRTGVLELFSPEEGNPRVPVTGITRDSHGNLWFSTYGEGIYCWDGTRFYNFSATDGLGDNFNYSIASDSHGNVWAGSDGGVSVCSLSAGKKRITALTSANGLPDNIVLKVYAPGSQYVWIGMHDGGICRIDTGSYFVEIPPGLEDWSYGPVNDLLISGNSLWAGTEDHGILSATLDGESRIRSYTRFGESDYNKISKLICDTEGNLWFLANNALIQSPGSNLEILSSADHPAFTNIHSILCDREGTVWFSNDEGLFRLKPGSGGVQVPERVLSLRDIPGVNIISLYQDRDGYLWIGTFGNGVYRMHPGTRRVERYTVRNGVTNDNILSITGTGNEIWLATLGGASRCILPSGSPAGRAPLKFGGFTEETGLGNNFIYCVFTDSQGRIWFGTDGKGLTVFNKSRCSNYSLEAGLNSRVVYSVTEDDLGHIWFSTSTAGIYEFDGSAFRNFTVSDGLSDPGITGLAIAGRSVFIVHTKGIDILDPTTGQINYLGEDEGIGNINPDLNTICYDREGGVIWIGTARGLLKLNPAAYNKPVRPITLLSSVRVFLTPTDTLEKHAFAFNRNHFTFDFVGLWYQAPERIHYQVMLEGYDLDWITTQNTRVIYSSLEPGTYTFHARASLNNDFSHATTASYTFTIRPPLWKTAWFLGLVLAVTASLFFFFIRARENRLRREENLVKEKILFQFETLKSQVNPHFLFNSFSTLSAIIDEDKEMALDYVQKLSIFFRNILEYRDKSVITLKEELALADTYYYLQKKRYGDKFTLLVEVAPIYLGTFIPPLTLQMILENSVKYNVISEDHPLTVRVFVSGDNLVISNRNQARKDVPVSTGVGLQNIRNRYRLLVDRDIRIHVTAEEYTVLLPLIKVIQP